MSSPHSSPTFSATDTAYNHISPASLYMSNTVGMGCDNIPFPMSTTSSSRSSLANPSGKTIRPMASIDELFSQIRQGLDRAEREKQEAFEREFQKRAFGRFPHAASLLDTRTVSKRFDSELMNSEPNKEDVDESTSDNRFSADTIVANSSAETICGQSGSRTCDEELNRKLHTQKNESNETGDDSKLNSIDTHSLRKRSYLDLSSHGDDDDQFNANIPTTRLVKSSAPMPIFSTQPCEDPVFNDVDFGLFSMPSSFNYNHRRPWTEEEKEGLTRLADKWIPTSDKKRRRLL